jgi:alkaline phosphatase D
MPSLSRAADRPLITHGVQSGDIDASGAMVWSRAGRPSRMKVEFSTTESFKNIIQGVFVDALPESDFTAKAFINGLPADQEVFYRLAFQSHADPALYSASTVGHFRTAPTSARSVSFCWSGDTVGQGWGIDEARGGMTIFSSILKNRPDFFLHSGDNVYADDPLVAERKLKDGTVWKNIVTEEKSKPAETLAEFRGQYKYNLLDKNLLALAKEVPFVVQWDDHEVTNNWWPTQPLTLAAHQRMKYKDSNILGMAARAARAFHEYTPMRFFDSEPGRIHRKITYGPLLDVFVLDMRSYRSANGENKESEYGPASQFLGPVQLAWLKRELANSKATWKVIAADMPIGLMVHDDWAKKSGSEGVANGDGPALGRELEIANLLTFIKRAEIQNTVWLTADVHYTAAHYYDPNKAQFQDFDPFHEFVSGPLHAGFYGPNDLDNTFGPQVLYQKTPPKEIDPVRPPLPTHLFFGHVPIDGQSQTMTVSLKDATDATLWSTKLEPKRA